MDGPAFDPKDFRRALGNFVTGVTIITTLRGQEPIGLTANSFNSVSLSPPLVLWSLDKSSPNLHAFETAEYFAVNILAADQADLSQHFAKHRPDKFHGINWQPGLGGVPMIDNVVAQFCCRTATYHDGGDHVIFIGRVEYYTHTDKHPLVFARGRYMDIVERG
jgi:3-hydroxy-9,10-secoandrosta-1,3,5(10)-triene-9,17-dione monooxygenase reductase component